ncbi:tRNA (guanosine(46)-N7)-methyltransferase TrmB [Verrucomicrobiota bacterium sgz303538]
MTREDFQKQHAAFLAAAERAEWKPANIFERAQMSEIFERSAPLEVDIGCGEGAFILARATAHPERNFLGIERLANRVSKVCRAAAREGLTNVRVLRLESAYSVKHVLPLGSISMAHVAFPDPWPKRHHQPRRLIQDEFLKDLRESLVQGGELRLKTDDLPYFQWMEKVISRAQGWERVDWPEDPDYPVTNFERKFLDQGLPIYRARLLRQEMPAT